MFALLLLVAWKPKPKLKELDLKLFKITIPKNWVYKKQQGEDSFIGQIVTSKSIFSFNYSSQGYANPLLETEKEYLNSDRWLEHNPFLEVGVTYTASFNVKNEKSRQMKEKGITDSNAVKVEPYPNPKREIHSVTEAEKQKFPKADYIAQLTYRNKSVLFPIQIPDKIKYHNIRIDTTDTYVIKTIWPKTIGKGITGIYIHSQTSHLNFNLVASNLSAEEQQQALAAFKTIKIIP